MTAGQKMSEAQEKLILSHMGLASAIAVHYWKTAPHALNMDELRAIANSGLVDAAHRWPTYCEKNGYSAESTQFFTTYADRRIRGTIVDSMRSSDWATRNLRDKFKRLREAGVLESPMSEAELAERTGLTVAEVHATLAGMARQPVSLEDTGSSGGRDPMHTEYRNLVADPNTVEGQAGSTEILDAFADAVYFLPKSQQVVVALRYFKGMELKRISQFLGVQESIVSSLHTEAVLKLLESLQSVAAG